MSENLPDWTANALKVEGYEKNIAWNLDLGGPCRIVGNTAMLICLRWKRVDTFVPDYVHFANRKQLELYTRDYEPKDKHRWGDVSLDALRTWMRPEAWGGRPDEWMTDTKLRLLVFKFADGRKIMINRAMVYRALDYLCADTVSIDCGETILGHVQFTAPGWRIVLMPVDPGKCPLSDFSVWRQGESAPSRKNS